MKSKHKWSQDPGEAALEGLVRDLGEFDCGSLSDKAAGLHLDPDNASLSRRLEYQSNLALVHAKPPGRVADFKAVREHVAKHSPRVKWVRRRVPDVLAHLNIQVSRKANVSWRVRSRVLDEGEFLPHSSTGLKLKSKGFRQGENLTNGNLAPPLEIVLYQTEATIRKFRIVQTEGARQVSRQIDRYNPGVILTVGHLVSSHRGTQFPQWATASLFGYLVKGFTVECERLNIPWAAKGSK